MQAATLKIVGDWKGSIGVPLRDALAVSMDVCGRVGEEACKHAIILMAQSAKAMTAKAPAKREVKQNNAGAKYVEIWAQDKARPSKLYKFQFETDDPKWKVEGTWENAQRIGNRGLAGRSWMFSLGRWGKSSGVRPMPGVSSLYPINSGRSHGYVLENRLSYMLKSGVMPAGWESEVQTRAGNRIMTMAVQKLDTQWRQEMNLPRRQRQEPVQDNAFLARYFAA